jgi:hypothetical protein
MNGQGKIKKTPHYSINFQCKLVVVAILFNSIQFNCDFFSFDSLVVVYRKVTTIVLGKFNLSKNCGVLIAVILPRLYNSARLN